MPFIGECLIVASSSAIKQKKSLASCVIDMFLEGGIGSILGNKEDKFNNSYSFFVGKKPISFPVSMYST